MSSNVAITVPGDIPGLIQRGATVRYYGYRCVVVTDPCYGVMLLSDGVSLVKSSVHFVSLDLSHPTGRDIAARWIAERLGMETGLTAPSLVPRWDGSKSVDWALTTRPPGLQNRSAIFEPVSSGSRPWLHHIPGLPLNSDRGPEVMRTIVLHLAGRS